MKPGLIEVDHTVKPGESLWSVAKSLLGDGNQWPKLAKMNHIAAPYRVLVGQRLKVMEIAGGSDHGPSLLGNSGASASSSWPAHFTPKISAHPSAGAPPGVMQPAAPVIPPAFKYEWKKSHPPVLIGELLVTQTVKGSIAIQDQRDMSGVTLDQKTVFEYKRQADGVLKDIDNMSKVKWDPSNPKKLEVSLGYAVKYHGEVLSVQYVTVVPPAGMKYSFEGREIVGQRLGYKFKAKIGFDIEAQPANRLRPQHPVPVPVPVREVTFWVGVGLVTVGTVMIGATVVENIGTGGLGAGIDAVTFPAAMRMIGLGLPALVR